MKLWQILIYFAVFNLVESLSNARNRNKNRAKTFLDEIKTMNTSDLMTKAIPGEFCSRKCIGDKKVCHFKFMIKFYQVLSGSVIIIIYKSKVKMNIFVELAEIVFLETLLTVLIQNASPGMEFNVEF